MLEPNQCGCQRSDYWCQSMIKTMMGQSRLSTDLYLEVVTVKEGGPDVSIDEDDGQSMYTHPKIYRGAVHDKRIGRKGERSTVTLHQRARK